MLPSDINSTQSSEAWKPASDPSLPPVPANGFSAPPVITPLPSLAENAGTVFVQALRRRWARALTLGLIAAAVAAGLVWLLLPPGFTAEAQIRVTARPPRGLFIDDSSYEGNDEFAAYMRTQSAWIKSRPVLNAALRQPQVADLAEIRAHADPIAWLEKGLVIDTTLGPELLRITLGGDRPEDLATILNAVADSYLQEASHQEQTKQQARLTQLQDSRRSYEETLRRKRATLRDLQETLGADDPTTALARYQSALQQLSKVEELRLQARVQLTSAETELTSIESRLQRPSATVAVPQTAVDEFLRQDPVAQKHLLRLSELDSQIGRIRALTKESTRDEVLQGPLSERAAAQAALDARRKEVQPQIEEQWRIKTHNDSQENIAKLKTTRDLNKEQIKALDAEWQRLDGLVKKLGAAVRPADRPTSDLEALRTDVVQTEAVLSKIDERLGLLKAEPRPPSRATVMVPAEPPRARNLQAPARISSVAALAAFGLVVGGVGWREARARRVYAADDVVQNLGISLLGTLPALPARSRRLLTADTKRRDTVWQSQLTESVDAIRTLLLYTAQAEGLRIILVTSASGGEGKTSLASHLAGSLARAWRKTLLLDGDLRNPSTHCLFNLPLEPGFSEVLRGEAELEDVVRPTPMSRLWTIPAGQWNDHAVQALAQKEVGKLFERLKEQFDFIVIDSSPVLPVADTLLLGQHADAVLFSVLQDVSRMPAVHAAHQRLATLGIRMLGTVVIGADSEATSQAYQYPRNT
jgi:polysaccharide biosynthesis transport protein